MVIIVTYFESSGAEYISKESKKFIDNKNITININRIQVYYSMMCGYFCIGFIDFMLNNERADFANLFSLNSFKKSNEIVF